MKYYLIIVSYNGEKWIAKCLQKIIDSTVLINVVLVDNNSTDNTLEIARAFEQVTVLPQKENLGFGKANNIGIKYALDKGADYIMLLNQDAYLEKQTYKTLITCLKDSTEFGIVSPLHYNGNGDLLDAPFKTYIEANDQLIFDGLNGAFIKNLYEVPFVNAACWLMPRRTFEIVGGFDPVFFHYGEDNNYCQRILYHNLKIGINPNTLIYHDRERSAKTKKNHIQEWSEFGNFIKIKLGNINTNKDDTYLRIRQKLKKDLLIALIKLNRKQILKNFKKLKLLNKTLQVIQESRSRNVLKTNNYLK